MPLINYRCLYCIRTFEILQDIKDAPLEFCGQDCQLEKYIGSNHLYTPLRENRGKGVVKKVLSTFGVRFKGSGFYETDYKDKKVMVTESYYWIVGIGLIIIMGLCITIFGA